MRFVIKIGGHLLDNNATIFKKYADQIKNLAETGHKLSVVMGGGYAARNWINLARSLGANEAALDEIGILISRLNAYLEIQLLSTLAYPTPPQSLKEFDVAWASSKIVVLGGLTPGQSTTGVSAIIAERIYADRLIILTNVDGVFTDEPTSPSAVFLPSVSIEQLASIISGRPALAGTYELLDDVSIKILKRSRIPTLITNGLYENVVVDAAFFKAKGTVIKY
jgi:uridylate kinase